MASAFHSETGLAFGGHVEFCVGFLAGSCIDILSADGTSGNTQSNSFRSSSYKEDSNAAMVMFTFDYETSSTPEHAGDDSIMFLIPALNVVYSKSLYVTFDAKICKAVGKEDITWSLNSPRNFHVCILPSTISSCLIYVVFISIVQEFAWKSMNDIQNVIIPTLKEIHDEQQSLLPQLGLHAAAAVKERISKLTTTISGWNSVVSRIRALHSQADLGKIPSTAASLIAVGNFATNDISMVPPELMSNLKTASGAAVLNKIGAKSISAFSFTGGGASLSFEEMQMSDSKSTSGFTSSSETDTGSAYSFKIKVVVIGFNANFDSSSGKTMVQSGAKSSEVTSRSTRTFTLSDPDAGDSFDVQVCGGNTLFRFTDIN